MMGFSSSGVSWKVNRQGRGVGAPVEDRDGGKASPGEQAEKQGCR